MPTSMAQDADAGPRTGGLAAFSSTEDNCRSRLRHAGLDVDSWRPAQQQCVLEDLIFLLDRHHGLTQLKYGAGCLFCTDRSPSTACKILASRGTQSGS
jgi:hypothetical protein